jgi:hypothetical protein
MFFAVMLWQSCLHPVGIGRGQVRLDRGQVDMDVVVLVPTGQRTALAVAVHALSATVVGRIDELSFFWDPGELVGEDCHVSTLVGRPKNRGRADVQYAIRRSRATRLGLPRNEARALRSRSSYRRGSIASGLHQRAVVRAGGTKRPAISARIFGGPKRYGGGVAILAVRPRLSLRAVCDSVG